VTRPGVPFSPFVSVCSRSFMRPPTSPPLVAPSLRVRVHFGGPPKGALDAQEVLQLAELLEMIFHVDVGASPFCLMYWCLFC